MIIFCDSSKEVYGFSCYSRCIENDRIETNLIFSKCKSAPTKTKSLPTLELMSVFLAMKCLPTILSSLCEKTVSNVLISVDAQVVLSWILSNNVKSKNVFANNRVKDIAQFRRDIKQNFSLDVTFKYVPTDLNPADLVTRGITFKEFSSKQEFWQHGPDFLKNEPVEWPTKQLGCLSEQSKLLTCSTIVSEIPSIFSITRFSNLHKLLRVTALVFFYLLLSSKKLLNLV